VSSLQTSSDSQVVPSSSKTLEDPDESSLKVVSIVMPIHNQADYIDAVVRDCLGVIDRLNRTVELMLVTNGCTDTSAAACRNLARSHREVRTIDLRQGGWGRAVRAGIAESSGDVIGYTNSARTSPEMLALMVIYAEVYPNAVLKVKRRIRDNARRQVGSLLFNLECKLLFELGTWDINGTPKLFPRSFTQLLNLSEDGELIDAELMAMCQRERYPVIEVPVLSTARRGGVSTTTYRTAARMYRGAIAMRRSMDLR
jgi:glycosyltransferase involved in cell wall biosynthesis